MERGKQVVRAVHSSKPIEGRTEPAVRVRALEGEAKWKEEKANCRNDDRSDNAFGKCRKFSLIATEEWGRDKEEIDREVGNDHKRHEWDGAFPFEIERADVVALRGDPIAVAVDD